MKFRFSMVNRLYFGFGILIVAFVVSSVLTFTNLQANKKANEQISEIYAPSISYLNELISLVNNSKMLIKNWVFIERQSETPDKISLKNIHSKQYPQVIVKLSELKEHWSVDDIELFDKIEKTLSDTLFVLQTQIMEQLNTLESYEDQEVVLEVSPMVEKNGEIIVFSNDVIEDITELKTSINECYDEINARNIENVNNFQRTVVIMGIVLVALSLFIFYLISRVTVRPVLKLREFLLQMARGILPDEHLKVSDDEIGDISQALNQFVDNMKRISSFALEIGNENFGAEYNALSEDDILGNSLITMRQNLKTASEQEQKRKQEDEIRNWTTKGLAEFGDILRQSTNIESLSYDVLEKAIEILGAIQGALYILEDNDEDDVHFRMTAAIAYGRKKLASRRVEIEEGLVGRCAFEQAPVYLKEVPQDYVRITSGLGDTNPSVILLVPLKANETIYGVIEIVSFNQFEEYQINFLEQVSENIAGTLATVKINEKTARLLEESQQKGEELASQEEEMRQNMEELQATQEESARRELEMREILEAINNSVGNIEFDLFGVIQNVNERYAQFLGLKEEDLIGREHRNLLKLTHKQDMLYREMWEGFTSGSSVEMDLCYPTSYGDVWLRETYTPLKDASGEYKKVLSLSVDISDNKTKDRAIHAYRRELDEQGENLKNIIDQLNTHKSESELRENELLKESEATEEENRVQIESMKLLIEDLEEKIRKLTAGKS